MRVGIIKSKMNLINLDWQDDVAVMSINRPDSLNALSFALLDEMEHKFKEVKKSKSRALIVTGTGDRAFCAGADVGELTDKTVFEHRLGVERGQMLFEDLSLFPVPVIAFINGYAFGGGLELALACDFRLAGPKAKMGLPEIKLGLIPGYGGTQRLPRLIGEARALELILTGKSISAVEALEMGLVNSIVKGDGIQSAIQFSKQFTGYSLVALRHARSAIKRAFDQPIQVGLRVEADCSVLTYQSDDAAEGIRAFVNKRDPVFLDK